MVSIWPVPRWSRRPSARPSATKTSAAPPCTPPSPAPSTSASRTTRPAWNACAASSACCRRTPAARGASGQPGRPPADLLQLYPSDTRQEYDIRDLLPCILDAGPFDEYKAEYGQTLVCGYGRLGGHPVGVVANQRKRCRPAEGPLQFGGVLYVDSADKAARFIMDCNQTRVPLLFLQDVNGFMVGRDSEHAGIIKAGAKLVNVIANSVVPKITVILGGSFGAGNYALCGKAFDPRFIFAWPTARYAVMGGEQAATHAAGCADRRAAPAGP